MVAVPEMPFSAPVAVGATGNSAVPTDRRVVAVTVGPMELLRPESDLARLAEGFTRIDLLVAGDDVARPDFDLLDAFDGAFSGPDGFAAYDGGLGGGYDGAGYEGAGYNAAGNDGAGYDDVDDYDDDWFDSAAAEVRAGIDRLGLPGLHLHRLGLRKPYPATAEDDLVAAMSELIGFDPEPGVYCLAPVPDPGDAARGVVNRAAQRIAQVYGIPLLRYRCLEFSVVC
jgi:hypothetical protein